jgi:predicted MFS family arabinose efflux permease
MTLSSLFVSGSRMGAGLGRVVPLAAGSVATGTTGYSLSGLLPSLSHHLGIAPAVAGQLLTVYALTCAATGPLVVMLTKMWPKRTVAVAALLVTATGNLATAMAPNLPLLVTARIVTAIGVGAYVPAASAAAAAISAQGQRARALATVISGLTFALLLGVPATTALLGLLGGEYPGVFVAIAALCLLAATAITLIAPSGARAPATTSAVGARSAVRDPQALALFGVTFMATVATFAVYTYLSQILAPSTVHGVTLSLLLAAYGVGAVTGNAVGGHLADRWHPERVVLASTVISCVALLALTVVSASPAVLMIVLVIWGAACWSIYAPVNTLLLATGGSHGPVLMSVNASSIYSGMAAGGLVGGLVIAGAGISVLSPIAAAAAAVAVGLVYVGAVHHRMSQ